MKRAFVLLPVVGAVSLITWMGCGGSTSTTTIDPAGAADGGGGSSGSGGATNGASGSAVGVDSGAPVFDPGAIGGLVGGGRDGGLAAPDAGMMGSGIISPEVVDGCNALCAKEAAANCPNQGAIGNCIVGCRLILNNPTCGGQANALFACEKTSPAACDAQGKATLTGCGIEQLNAASCFLTNAADPTLKGPCTSYCAGVAAAKCPNDDPAGCAVGCPVVGNYIRSCNTFWQGYVTCASTAMFTCGMDGKAGAPACALQGTTYALCLYSALLSAGDGGR